MMMKKKRICPKEKGSLRLMSPCFSFKRKKNPKRRLFDGISVPPTSPPSVEEVKEGKKAVAAAKAKVDASNVAVAVATAELVDTEEEEEN